LIAQQDPADQHAALRLVAALRYYWPSRGLMQQGIALTRSAVERATALPFDHAQASALASLALMLVQTGEHEASQSWSRQLLERAAAAGDDSDRLMARLVAGEVDCSGGRLDRARGHFLAAQQLAVALGQVRRQIGALSGLARVAAHADQAEEAARLADEVLALRRRDGHGYNLVIALLNVASTALERDQVERAMPLLAEAVALSPRVGSDYLTAHVLALSAQLFARRGRWAAAVELRAAAHLQEQEQRLFVHETDRQQQETGLERARQALGDPAFEAAWQAGLVGPAASGLARAAEHLRAEATPGRTA
jgi:tetratricopeptide (TPR) repeat protein